MLNKIVLVAVRAFASSSAWRREPGPLSLVLVTTSARSGVGVNVAVLDGDEDLVVPLPEQRRDVLRNDAGPLVQLFGDTNAVAYDAYFVYPEELKAVARVQVFRDFLVAKAQRWHY